MVYTSGWPVVEGNQAFWLQTNNVADGYQSQTISQTLSSTAVEGQTYVLNFAVTCEYGWGTPNITAKILINGVIKSSKTISNVPAGAGWLFYSTPAYTAAAADAGKSLSVQFYFENLGDPVWHAKTYLDAISLTDAPQPYIAIQTRPSKIHQLIGDWDKERNQPTLNRTGVLYGLPMTDLGTPFSHNGRTYIVFGDSWNAGDDDPIAYSEDTNLEDGLSLTFLQNPNGTYRPVTIPGISLQGYEVPMEGVSVNGKMYVYATTDHSQYVTMGRSVLAVSNNNGYNFSYLYDLSVDHFINVSVVKVDSSQWQGFPLSEGEGLVMFGSGIYRESNVKLAFQPASQIETKNVIRYFAGLDAGDIPIWSTNESDAIDLFNQPSIGELSVSYNKFIKRWIMLYNDFTFYRGINMRTAKYPWGPWSPPQVIFEPWADNGYCHFMHASWEDDNPHCDSVHDTGRQNIWGGEYGPYQFEDFATGNACSTTIYFTMSTWNPYTVVLMKATLGKTSPDSMDYMADYNRDNSVDFQDYAELAANWFLSEPTVDLAPQPCGDGFIDIEDFAAFISSWLNSSN